MSETHGTNFGATSEYRPSTMSVMIAYLLSGYPTFTQLPVVTRTQLSFLFELFARGRMLKDEFLSATEDLFPEFSAAARILVSLVVYPEVHLLWPSNNVIESSWGRRDTLLLLGSRVLGGFLADSFERLVPNRSLLSRSMRIHRVTAEVMAQNLISLPITVQHVSTASQTCQPEFIHQRSTVARQRLVAQMRQTVKVRKQFAQMRSRIAVSERKIKRLEARLFEYEKATVSEGNNDGDTENNDNISERFELLDCMLRECQSLIRVAPKQRRYSKFMLDISQLLYLTSPKAYQILRQLIPMPCPTALWDHFSGEFRLLKSNLVDNSQMNMRVRDVVKSYGRTKSQLVATLGVDAFAFSSFAGFGPVTSENRGQEFNNGFLFLSIPLDADLPVRVIHIEPATNGCFDGHIMELAQAVRGSYKDNGGDIWFVATDGDRFLNAQHDSFFETHIARYQNDFFALLNVLFDYVQDGNSIPIADPLHFGKNMRGKLLDHDVAIIENGDRTVTTNAENLCRFLKLGDTLTDTSHIGRMRDYYVTRLFTLKNVSILLTSGQFHSALMLLPYACVYSVLYCSNLSLGARLYLVRLAYLTYQRLCEEAEKLVKAKFGVKYRGVRQARAITMAEVSYFRRMMNTCLAFGLALTSGPRNVRLDAIGTHLVENFIGVARSTSNSTDFKRIITAFANGDMRKTIGHGHSLKLHVARRINDGGVKVDTGTSEGLAQPPWDPYDIISMIIERHLEFGNCENKEFDIFLAEFQLFTAQLEVHQLHHPSAVANALIVDRNFKFGAASKRNMASYV